jgi:hypothetical protein
MRMAYMLAGVVALVPSSPEGSEALQRVVPVALDQLQVTQGELRRQPGGLLSVDVPRLRAVVPGLRPAAAELRFTWRGPTRLRVPLQSGEERQQVGLKLRARDGCNCVYIMWRLEPEPSLVVQVKHNPGLHEWVECGNEGYQTVQPHQHEAPPAMVRGQPHVLRVELRGRELRVLADGALTWGGLLPPEVLTFDGPVGLRADNGRFDLELRATPPAARQAP